MARLQELRGVEQQVIGQMKLKTTVLLYQVAAEAHIILSTATKWTCEEARTVMCQSSTAP